MTDIEIDIRKTVPENAEHYYQLAKKAKRRIQGAEKIIEETKLKLAQLEKEKEKVMKEIEAEEKEKEEKKKIKERKKEWFEKFRWFITSGGFLAVGGRDATTNDILIKKHLEKTDIVFHTETPGSPFFLIKTEGKKVDEESLKEVAQATGSFSNGWKLGVGNTDVYWVNPDQVSQKANTGEYMGKGSFMIYGKRNMSSPTLEITVGITKDGRIMAGPESAVTKHCEKFVRLLQGKRRASDVAKLIQSKIGGDLDEILRSLPGGEFEVRKEK